MTRASSRCLWATTAAPAPVTSSLQESLRCDVAVVGGGYTGTSTALHLAERGARVVLIEAGAIGDGAAGRSSGLVNAGMWVLPDDLPNVLGPRYGERLLHALGEAPKEVAALISRHNIDCELERNGTLQCAIGRSGLQVISVRGDQWTRRGAAVELLDAKETARRVGTDRFAGALYDKRASTLQPLAYVRGLASAATQAGAAIFTDSPVTHTQRDGSVWVLRTPRSEVRADHVVGTTDAYTSTIWPEVSRG